MEKRSTGVCIARQETIRYITGDILEPVVHEIHGVSTTLPMSFDRFDGDDYSFVDVFMPQVGFSWVGFSIDEFDEYFIVVHSTEDIKQNIWRHSKSK